MVVVLVGSLCGYLQKTSSRWLSVYVCVNYIKVCECVDYIVVLCVCVYVYILYKYNVGGAKEKGLIKLFSSA